jgi:iron complex outermembrane receptor protein
LASFNFQATPNMLFYIKTSRGFRGGGIQARDPVVPAFSPEKVTDYEAGYKAEFFNQRLRTNFAAFHSNYKNKQETAIQILSNGSLTTAIQNASSATIDGVEAEVNATPVRGWSVYGNMSYTFGKYLSFPNALTSFGFINASGLPFSIPKWHYSVGSRYELDAGPGKLGGQLDWAWQGKTPQTKLDGDPGAPTAFENSLFADRGLLNARVDYTLPDHQITVALFSTNLLDKHYMTATLPSTYGLPEVPGEPRMWGVSVRKAFGNE